MQTKDFEFMSIALTLGIQGQGKVSPNPMVGCVIVKEDQVVAQGYHEKYGGYHAERNALIHAGDEVKGATAYVTLEPCCHYGKTPPCTDILIEKGIKRVVVGGLDPNPQVAGQGVDILRKHGIEVKVGVLEQECKELNHIFMHYITRKKPYIALKFGMSLDGKIATWSGESKWITSQKSREHSYALRHQYSAILVGIETVIQDDPMLDAKKSEFKNPTRIVCDTHLRISEKSKIVQTSKTIPTIIATASDDSIKKKNLQKLGCEVLEVEKLNDHLNLEDLVLKIGNRGIDSILVEGGGIIHDAFLRNQLVQRIHAYIAPIVIGGQHAKSAVSGFGFEALKDAPRFKFKNVQQIGDDIYVEGEL